MARVSKPVFPFTTGRETRATSRSELRPNANDHRPSRLAADEDPRFARPARLGRVCGAFALYQRCHPVLPMAVVLLLAGAPGRTHRDPRRPARRWRAVGPLWWMAGRWSGAAGGGQCCCGDIQSVPPAKPQRSAGPRRRSEPSLSRTGLDSTRPCAPAGADRAVCPDNWIADDAVRRC